MPPSPSAASPLPGLLLLLSVTTGMVDAVSVLGLGKVFTANLTGNVVFLGFAAALLTAGVIILFGTLLCVRHPAATLPHSV